MQYAATRAYDINGIAYSEDAASWNLAIKGSMTGRGRNDSACQLSNLTASTDLHVAYVDAGKSTFVGDNISGTIATSDDWKFSFTRIGSGTKAICNSSREFNIGEDMKTSYTTGTGVLLWAAGGAGEYYIVKIITPTAQVATFTQHGTFVKIGSRFVAGYETTKINLRAGENTFLCVSTNTAPTITLATNDASALCYVYKNTAWTGGQCQVDY